MAEIIVLRIVHVVGGVFWVGSSLFSAVYLFPAMAAAGPAAGAIMGSMQQRRLFIVLPTVALLTVLSGLRLMWITSAGFSAAYFETGRGVTFGLSGAVAIVAFLVGMFVARPIGMRMGAAQQALAGAQDDATRTRLRAEVERLGRRSAFLGKAVNALLVLAVVGMAAGRYVP